MNGRQVPRVLVACIEGADWRVLSPRVDAGGMPVLASLIARGAMGRVAPLDRCAGIPAWATVLTGASAVRHRVLSGLVPTESGEARPVTCGDRALPTLWERAERAGLRTVVAGWGEPFVPGRPVPPPHEPCAPAWADSIAASADAAEPELAAILRALAAAFDDELRTTVAACGARPWDLACVHVAGWAALVREFVRFAPPPGAGVPAARAAAFGGVVDAACAALDAWLDRLLTHAGDGAAVVAVGDRGIDLARWRTPALIMSDDPVRLVEPAPAAFVAVAPGIRPDSLRHGLVAADVARVALDAIGVDGFVRADAQAAAFTELPAEPHGPTSGALRELLQERDAAFAHAAAAAGASDAALAARRRMAARIPEDVANASALAESLVVRGDALGALAAIEACRRASGGAARAALELAAARALVAAERITEAAASIVAAADAGAPEEAVHLARALVATSSGDYAGAERHARAAIATGPASREAHLALAHALFGQERFPEAADAARDALALGWADPRAHLLLGTALAAAGRARESIAALEDCLRVRPDFPPALRRLAAVHARQLGDIGTAQSLLARARSAARAASPTRPLP